MRVDSNDCLLVRVLRDPGVVRGFTTADWDLLVRQSRRADLLARLRIRLGMADLLGVVPQQPLDHMDAALHVANKHARIVCWEIEQIRDAIADCEIPVVLLKGAAYVAAGLPPARGRLFSDIDIMVPKTALGRAEQRLLMHGWVTGKLNAYDQMYYRRWMHELPPMTHRRRETVLDVHHNILPLTSRYRVEAETLFAGSVAIDGGAGMRMLAPADMLIHCAAHLFCDGEFDHALRDIVDFDDLFIHFCADPAFPDSLCSRAREIGLERPLYYAFRYRERLLGSARTDQRAPDALAQSRPGRFIGGVMDRLFEAAIVPNHPSCNHPLSGLARGSLYLRGHYLRMPWYLLIPHLLRKSLRDADG